MTMALDRTARRAREKARRRIVLGLAAATAGLAAALRFYNGDVTEGLMATGVAALFIFGLFLAGRP